MWLGKAQDGAYGAVALCDKCLTRLLYGSIVGRLDFAYTPGKGKQLLDMLPRSSRAVVVPCLKGLYKARYVLLALVEKNKQLYLPVVLYHIAWLLCM